MSTDHENAKEGLTPDQLKAKLSLYVGSLPSTVIEDLYQTLKSMGLQESKVDEIINKALQSYSGQETNTRMDELVEKMNSLEDTLIRALKKIDSRQEKPIIEEPSENRQEFPPLPSFSDPRPQQQSKSASVEKEEVEEEEDEEPAPAQKPQTRQRVLLYDVPDDAISNAVMLKWVEFLLETVGHQNLPEVLDYYVDIGWISEKVTMKLLAYASGMVAPRGRAKEKLSTKDHLRSLLFIEKLRGKDFDQSKLTRLEREIEYTIEKRIRSD